MRAKRQGSNRIIGLSGFSTLDLEYKVFLEYFKFPFDKYRLTDKRIFQYFKYVSLMKDSFSMQNRNYTILMSS